MTKLGDMYVDTYRTLSTFVTNIVEIRSFRLLSLCGSIFSILFHCCPVNFELQLIKGNSGNGLVQFRLIET